MVLLYRWAIAVPLETPMAKVRTPVSGLVLSCQPSESPDLAMIWPSSGGFAVEKTHALRVVTFRQACVNSIGLSCYVHGVATERLP